MLKQDTIGIIIAAGNSTRMNSNYYKQEYMLGSKILVQHSVDALQNAGVGAVIVVLNPNLAHLEEYLTQKDGVHVAYQTTMKGTAGAVVAGIDFLKNGNHKLNHSEATPILITCGDMPLINSDTYNKVLDFYTNKGVDVVIASTNLANPFGYGRVVRNLSGSVDKIVEHKDASANELKITEINTGVYASNIQTLSKLLAKVGTANSSNEYYLTDIVTPGSKALTFDDAGQFTGINTKEDLALALKIYYKRNAVMFTRNFGAIVMDMDNVYIDHDVQGAKDVTVYPNVTLQGTTSIGEGTIIHSGSRVQNSIIAENVTLLDGSIIIDSTVGEGATIGPYAYLRPGNTLGEKSKVGTFVEMKKSTLGNNTKVPHLSYIGDTIVGSNTNIGCGTITANYDGFNKHTTKIGNNSFVGSGVTLVAPVDVDDHTMVAAGTTVTQDVPTEALGISRTPQRNIDNFVTKYRKAKTSNSTKSPRKVHK